MTKIWYKAEFTDDGHAIGLISIGMVREPDTPDMECDTLHLVNRNADLASIQIDHDFAAAMLPHLPVEFDEAGMARWNLDDPQYSALTRPQREMDELVCDFIVTTPGEPRLVSWYAAYDHVALMQLLGRSHGRQPYRSGPCRGLSRLGDCQRRRQPPKRSMGPSLFFYAKDGVRHD